MAYITGIKEPDDGLVLKCATIFTGTAETTWPRPVYGK